MNRKHFLESLENVTKDEEVYDRIMSKYEMTIPELIIKILTKYPLPVLFDENESRTLSLNEVLHAEDVFDFSFKEMKLIPIVDLGDSDYLVYDGNESDWYMFNSVEKIIFGQSTDFETIFLK